VTLSTIPAHPSSSSEPLRQRRGQQQLVENGFDAPGSGGDASTTMSFEQLKREAAALERQLEDKLSRYQQVRRL